VASTPRSLTSLPRLANQGLSPGSSRGFTNQGPATRRRPAPLVPALRAFPRRGGRAPSRTRSVRQAGRRTWTRALPRPDPLGHLMSRDGRDIGWRSDVAGHRSGRSLAADLPSRRTSSSLGYPSWLVGPSVRLARARRPRFASRCKREAPAGRPASVQFTRMNRTAPLGTAGTTVCSHNPLPRGQGPLPPSLREEERARLHPRCLPSMGCVRSRRWTCAQGRSLFECRLRWHPTRPEPALANPPGQGVLHSFSPACGDTRCLFRVPTRCLP